MTCDVGIVGLAVMGSNLALNIADKKFEVAVFNRTYAKTEAFLKTNESYKNLHGSEKMEDFIKSLKKPRKVLVLVMAGAATDSTIELLSKLMDKDDIIVDTGNAHFRDQSKRAEQLEAKGLRFLGMGISGGEEGARKGPAFFPGGTLSVWEDIKPIIEAAAAKASDGRPCVCMNGKGGAGSCVKMYHNAGEYAILQLWGEVSAVMKGFGIAPKKQQQILASWKKKKGGSHPNFLSSYMLDITVEVVAQQDAEESGGSPNGLLIDRTMDKIGSKGTGLWSVQEALGAGVPAPSLAEAVTARQMSMFRDERLANASKIKVSGSKPKEADRRADPTMMKGEKGANKLYSKDQFLEFYGAQRGAQLWKKAGQKGGLGSATDEDLEDLFWAVALAIIASYAQMFQCLRELDKLFEFGLDLPKTIATFRAGCILQGYLLEPMTKAFEADKDLSSLLVAFKPEITKNLSRYKRIMAKVLTSTNVPTPVLSASLAYIQTMTTTAIASAQVVALQRDVFGRHGFKRLDKEGHFSAKWKELQ